MMGLRVSDNRRFLVREDGSPFFYLGDTAWELFHRLTMDEAKRYLAKRAEQRFTVIQAVALAELDGLNTANTDGHHPLHDNDPTKPNDAYFKHVDKVVAEANRLGLVVGFLPTWGDKWNLAWSKGETIFTPENARAYGEWLGRRYRDADLIWILGGDRPIDTDEHLEIHRAMAAGLRAGDGGNHLITFHPMGGRGSAEKLHHEPWLDFNANQSGHGARDGGNWRMIEHDYALQPTKPTLDMEPPYENHPVKWQPENLGWFNDYDVRKGAYWPVFAGAFGHTYGCHDVWQMRDEGRDSIGYARNYWHEVLALPGAMQMRHLRSLIESRPFLTRVPDQSLVLNPPDEPARHIQATRDEAGTYAMVYLPVGGKVQLNLTALKGAEVSASWFSPRTGEFKPSGQIPIGPKVEFEAPSALDWVLVLDAVP